MPDDIQLTPSPNGEDCLGNGEHEGVEIQCDECDYYLECFPDWRKDNGNEMERGLVLSRY